MLYDGGHSIISFHMLITSVICLYADVHLYVYLPVCVAYSGNTLLHIFGNWLFEAAVWEGQDQEGFPLRRKSHSSTTVISSAADVTKLKDGNQTNTQQRVCES